MSGTRWSRLTPRADVWVDIVNGRRHGAALDFLRSVLAVLAGIYCTGLAVYLWLEKVHVRKRFALPVPVVSVGNLTVGGTGKTPFVQFVCNALSDQGLRIAVLSRGHGGSTRAKALLVSDGSGSVFADAKQAGDEACLLARSLQQSLVVVGKDRRVSGRLATQRFTPDLIVLDDGFQYWQLGRDLDIVLLDASEPFANGYTLPRGLLREPKRHLNRAHIVVVTRADDVTSMQKTELRKCIGELSPKAHVFFATHEPDGWEELNALAAGRAPENALCFCGVARPASFLKSVQRENISLADEPLVFADHEPYRDAALSLIVEAARHSHSSCFVTTQKDAVKLDAERLPLPAFALRTRIAVDDAQLLISSIMCCVTSEARDVRAFGKASHGYQGNDD